MKKFLKEMFTNALAKVLGGSLGVVLLGGITLILDKIKNIDYGTTIGNMLTYRIPVWIILVVILVVWIVASAYKHNKRKPFLSVTETTEVIMGFRWRWEWKKNEEGKYEIFNFHPICSICGEIMSIEWGEREYKCINGHAVRSASVDGIRACRHAVEHLKSQFPKYKSEITSELI